MICYPHFQHLCKDGFTWNLSCAIYLHRNVIQLFFLSWMDFRILALISACSRLRPLERTSANSRGAQRAIWGHQTQQCQSLWLRAHRWVPTLRQVKAGEICPRRWKQKAFYEHRIRNLHESYAYIIYILHIKYDVKWHCNIMPVCNTCNQCCWNVLDPFVFNWVLQK